MSDEQPPMPDESTAPPADPFDADLVAYLDGELEPAAARKVEARLATDPAARAKATALKKTFDLLDYLPKPEPSPTFTTRTLERLPAMKSGANKTQNGTPQPSTSQPAPASAPRIPTAVSSSVPIALATSSLPMLPPPPARWGVWAAGVLIAVSVCAAAGYFATDALRPYLFPPQPTQPYQPEELQIADHHVIENLPLYAAVDDLDYLNELAKPEFFGDDPSVSFDQTFKLPAVEAEKPSGPAFEKLASAFKALHPSRQQAIRDLDKQLHTLDGATREQRFRVLEVYTLWLNRLPEAEHKQVLAADTARRRLDEIRKIRNQQWLDALPPAQRAKLNGLPAAQQGDLIRQWREEEQTRREDWVFHRAHAEDIAANKVPWPFDNADRRQAVIEFVRVAYRIDDDEKTCRFNELDRIRYTQALNFANDRGGWVAWYGYGRTVHELMRRYELFPEPATGVPITEYKQLGRAEKYFEKGKGRNATSQYVGKWPDFAVAVHKYATDEKGDKIPLPLLGPAKPSEFKEPLRSFVTKELMRSVQSTEHKTLEALEGKWPEYPQAVVRFAKQQDLIAPGLMVPVSPKRWESMYGFARPKS